MGVPGAVAVDQVVDDPDTALSHAITLVEDARAAEDTPIVLIATGNLDFDARVAAATGSGVVLAADGEGCSDAAAVTRIRMAVAGMRAHGATVLGVALTGAAPGAVADLDLDVPVAAAAGDLTGAVSAEVAPVMGPQRFQWWLTRRAKEQRRHIVLPEGDDDRILIAAAEILAEGICELTILGDPEAMRARAAELGADISGAHLMDPAASEHREAFAEEFAELRKAKGVTLEQARETMNDISYFATMMIHKGLADGMVSGAAHTTAHTIKPSFQIIKTRPGVSTVSSLFLMVMQDRLWGFADCAVMPNPTPDQLGEIAVSSAGTAAAFGIEPRVAMLSYSTGASGTGGDVDRVVAGLARAREIDPELAVDGPLQFDASVDPGVAAKKMPDSAVAGRANVFVFPDLDAGNIGYKIAQRCGGALAVGPILQGLNKPVNDLSRGASVADIVNTVAITAIQAGGN
nr:phosphate acetyltransferase [Corynebacterium sphenisci]